MSFPLAYRLREICCKTSCFRFATYQARLLMSVLVYNLSHMLSQFYLSGKEKCLFRQILAGSLAQCDILQKLPPTTVKKSAKRESKQARGCARETRSLLQSRVAVHTTTRKTGAKLWTAQERLSPHGIGGTPCALPRQSQALPQPGTAPQYP